MRHNRVCNSERSSARVERSRQQSPSCCQAPARHPKHETISLGSNLAGMCPLPNGGHQSHPLASSTPSSARSAIAGARLLPPCRLFNSQSHLANSRPPLPFRARCPVPIRRPLSVATEKARKTKPSRGLQSSAAARPPAATLRWGA